MEILLLLLLGIATVLLPIVVLPFNILAFIFSKKYKKIIAFFIAISLASIAYTWAPDAEKDLYNWHLEMKQFTTMDIQGLILFIKENLEPLNYTIKYIFAQIGDFNLLQFFVSFVGYYGILWMLADYAKLKNINNKAFFIVTFFIIFSLRYVDFISGLWFSLSIILFAIGIYLDYIRNTKHLHWVFYILGVMTHTSCILLLGLLLIIKIFKIKNYKKAAIISFLVAFNLGTLIVVLNNLLDVEFVHIIYKLYTAYFVNGAQFQTLHTGTNLLATLARLIICILVVWDYKKDIKEFNKSFLMFTLICTTSFIAIIPSALVYTRFIFFIQLILIPVFLEYFSKKYNQCKVVILYALICVLMFLSYRQINSMNYANIFPCINNNLDKSIFTLKNGTD